MDGCSERWEAVAAVTVGMKQRTEEDAGRWLAQATPEGNQPKEKEMTRDDVSCDLEFREIQSLNVISEMLFTRLYK